MVSKPINLIPRKFKTIAWILIVMGIFLPFSSKFVDFSDQIKPIVKHSSKSLVLIGLFTFALLKPKIEDEMEVYIRLKAFSFSFIAGVAYAIVTPYTNLIFDGLLIDNSIFQLLLTMFIVFFLSLYSEKKKLE
jgi:undecaprenyl pyrophosphate phosphatase UppP